MALVNHETKEIYSKVLYAGPSMSGKTTSLRALYKDLTGSLASSPSDLFLEKEELSNKFFEFLPIGLGKVKSYEVRLHVYTRPFWGVYETLEGLIFHNLDGVVYVFDSEPMAMDDNIDELGEVRERLDDKGYNLAEFPQVLQYNKRDLSRKLPLSLLNAELNSYKMPAYESIATQSVGVREALLDLSEQILKKLVSQENH